MVLTPEFWIERSKEETDEYTEKIIKDNVTIRIQLPENSYQVVENSFYKGNDFNSYYDEILKLLDKKVNEFAIKQPRGILWFVRPIDEPKNISSLLIEKGFTKTRSEYKLGIDLQAYEHNISITDLDFDIEEVGEEKMLEAPIINLMLNNFNFVNIEQVKQIQRMVIEIARKKGNKIVNYIAYTKEDHKPVAHAGLIIRKDIPGVAELSGAVTDENYRHKGIYSTLLCMRIKRCKKLGLKYIVVNADQSTSGPILQKFDFNIIDTVDVYNLDFGK